MSLVSLPQEILIMISNYLKAPDKINLSNTCKSLFERMQDRQILRKLDFSCCYGFEIETLGKFLKNTISVEYVTELNITSCYWLKNLDIYKCVKRMINLHSLYAVDCDIKRNQLFLLLQSLNKLQRLSLTWNYINIKDVREVQASINSISSQLSQLDFLCLYLNTNYLINKNDMKVLELWFQKCSNLKELWVISTDFELSVLYSIHPISVNFLHLHTLVLLDKKWKPFTASRGYSNSFFGYIVKGCNLDKSKYWKTFWVTGVPNVVVPQKISNTVMMYLDIQIPNKTFEICPDLEHVSVTSGFFEDSHQGLVREREPINGFPKYLSDLLIEQHYQLKRFYFHQTRFYFHQTGYPLQISWDTLWTSFPNLEELQFKNCITNISTVYNLEKLTKLSISSCILSEDNNPALITPKNPLQIIVESCPNIREFKFEKCPSCPDNATSEKMEPAINILSKWTNLRRLTLKCLNIILTGKPFSQIFQSCSKLESISLENLGPRGYCRYEFQLQKALAYCSNLKDFRIHQENITSIDNTLLSLKKCSKLERLSIISIKQQKRLKESNILYDLIENFPKLVFCFMVLDKISIKECQRVKTNILIRYKKSHPALCVNLIRSLDFYRDMYVRNIPLVHLNQMVISKSVISTVPENLHFRPFI